MLSLTKSSVCFERNFQQTKNKREFILPDLQNPTANIVLNGSPKIRMFTLTASIQHYTGDASKRYKARKQTGKEKRKT